MGRRNLDAYYSPTSVAQWLLEKQEVDINTTDTILECSVGDGAIAKPLRAAGYRVWTNDINENIEADYHDDITQWNELPTLACFDWIITNPPFNCLNVALPLMWHNCNKGMALFVRKSITEPTIQPDGGRQDWLEENQEHLAQIIYCPRVSFTGDGKTDQVACDWYIWTKEKANGCKVRWVKK